MTVGSLDSLEDNPLSFGQPVVTFPWGLPGFPEARRFGILPLGPEYEPFCKMTCLDAVELEFIVFPPAVIFSDYEFEMNEDDVTRLDIKDASDVVALVLVTIPEPPSAPTANLLGPIVVNRANMTAMQIVLHGSNFAVATPLTA